MFYYFEGYNMQYRQKVPHIIFKMLNGGKIYGTKCHNLTFQAYDVQYGRMKKNFLKS
jgi:hypothetical protein